MQGPYNQSRQSTESYWQFLILFVFMEFIFPDNRKKNNRDLHVMSSPKLGNYPECSKLFEYNISSYLFSNTYFDGMHLDFLIFDIHGLTNRF